MSKTAFAPLLLIFTLGLSAWPHQSPLPTITNVDPPAGEWDAVVTVTGTGFGSTQGDNLVTFNRLDATAYLHWSDTEIVVEVPRRATPGNVVVSLHSTRTRDFGTESLTLTHWEDSNGVPFTVTGDELEDAIEIGDEGWEEETYGNETVESGTLQIPWETILANGEDFGLIASEDPEGTPGELDPAHNLSSGWVGVRKMVDSLGTVRHGTTCVFCHEGRHPITGEAVAGLPNTQLDLGAMFALSPVYTAAQKECLRQWGPGRLDVGLILFGSVCNPSNTPQHLLTTGFSSLEWTGLDLTIDARNTGSIFLEAATRSPTAKELEGLSVYTNMIDKVVENPNVHPLFAKLGRKVFFDSKCQDCHSSHLGRYSNLDSIPLSVIGTDPQLTSEGTIATGFYRVAPLANLWAGAPYFHDGTLATIEEIFDEARLDPNFVATGTPPEADKPGGVLGHEFALSRDWTQEQRAEIIEFLKSVPDTCPGISNPEQTDGDGDGIGDLCDLCPSHRDQRLTLGRARLRSSGEPGDDSGRLRLRGSLSLARTEAMNPLSENVSLTLADSDGSFFSATIPAGSFTSSRFGTRFSFRDSTGTAAGGVTRMRLEIRVDGTASWSTEAKSSGLPDHGEAVEVSLVIGNDCYTDVARCQQSGGSEVRCGPSR